jgi:hypothetical protein
MHARFVFVAVAAAFVAVSTVFAPQRADAGTGAIIAFQAVAGAGSITFTATSPWSTMLAGSQQYGYLLAATTSPTPGTVTITAPTITGSGGNTIPKTAFSALCSLNNDPQGMFSSIGVVQLGASPVTCGTLAANKTSTLSFIVTLYLDTTSDANAFAADTYTSAALTLTANAP